MVRRLAEGARGREAREFRCTSKPGEEQEGRGNTEPLGGGMQQNWQEMFVHMHQCNSPLDETHFLFPKQDKREQSKRKHTRKIEPEQTEKKCLRND